MSLFSMSLAEPAIASREPRPLARYARPVLGLGDIDDARMKKAIDILVEANKLPRTPSVSEIFTRELLPPKADRPTKLVDVKMN